MLEYKLEDNIKRENPLRCIRLMHSLVYTVDDSGSNKHCFCIVTQHDSRQYLFQALSEEDQGKWVRLLENAITECSTRKLSSSVWALDQPPSVFPSSSSPSSSSSSPSPSSSSSPSPPPFSLEPFPKEPEGHEEMNFGELVKKFREAILVLDESLIVVAANQAACKLVGMEKEELEGKSVLSIFTSFPSHLTSRHLRVGLVRQGREGEGEAGAASVKKREVSLSVGHLHGGHHLLRLSEVSKASRFSIGRAIERIRERPRSSFF